MKQTLSAQAPQHPRKLTTLNSVPTDTKMKGRSSTTIGDDGTASGLSRSSRLLMYGSRSVLKYREAPTIARLNPISCLHIAKCLSTTGNTYVKRGICPIASSTMNELLI